MKFKKKMDYTEKKYQNHSNHNMDYTFYPENY